VEAMRTLAHWIAVGLFVGVPIGLVLVLFGNG
jgi:hypothetical protein